VLATTVTTHPHQRFDQAGACERVCLNGGAGRVLGPGGEGASVSNMVGWGAGGGGGGVGGIGVSWFMVLGESVSVG
jgi:hypothetical protein